MEEPQERTFWGLAGGAAGKTGLGNRCCYLHFPDAAWEWQAEDRWAEDQSPWLIVALTSGEPTRLGVPSYQGLLLGGDLHFDIFLAPSSAQWPFLPT